MVSRMYATCRRWLVLGLVFCRGALWWGLLVSAPEQVVGFTDFSICGLLAIGRDGRLSQVVFQERFVWPVGVLQEGDVVGARPLEGSHLVGRHPHEV